MAKRGRHSRAGRPKGSISAKTYKSLVRQFRRKTYTRKYGRGRPKGAISRATYLSLVAQHDPSALRGLTPRKARDGRGRPAGSISQKTYQGLVARYFPSTFSKYVPHGHRGRPMSSVQSLKVLGGNLRVKLAKSRVVKIGNTEVVV